MDQIAIKNNLSRTDLLKEYVVPLRFTCSNTIMSMKGLINIFPIILVIALIGCSGSTIFVDENTSIEEYDYVEWGITTSDSVINFSDSEAGSAKIIENNIIHIISEDSSNVYQIMDFKALFINNYIGFENYLIGVLIAVSIIYGAFFVGGPD